VRACFFLYAIHRFHLPTKPGFPQNGRIPYDGYVHLLERRFEEALELFCVCKKRKAPTIRSPARCRGLSPCRVSDLSRPGAA
jgi:hypothetical protein